MSLLLFLSAHMHLRTVGQENPDENLLVAVGDALPILARTLGPDAYAPIFAQHHASALLKWTRASQPDAVRAAGVGEPPLLRGLLLDSWIWPPHVCCLVMSLCTVCPEKTHGAVASVVGVPYTWDVAPVHCHQCKQNILYRGDRTPSGAFHSVLLHDARELCNVIGLWTCNTWRRNRAAFCCGRT